MVASVVVSGGTVVIGGAVTIGSVESGKGSSMSFPQPVNDAAVIITAAENAAALKSLFLSVSIYTFLSGLDLPNLRLIYLIVGAVVDRHLVARCGIKLCGLVCLGILAVFINACVLVGAELSRDNNESRI